MHLTYIIIFAGLAVADICQAGGTERVSKNLPSFSKKLQIIRSYKKAPLYVQMSSSQTEDIIENNSQSGQKRNATFGDYTSVTEFKTILQKYKRSLNKDRLFSTSYDRRRLSHSTKRWPISHPIRNSLNTPGTSAQRTNETINDVGPFKLFGGTPNNSVRRQTIFRKKRETADESRKLVSVATHNTVDIRTTVSDTKSSSRIYSNVKQMLAKSKKKYFKEGKITKDVDTSMKTIKLVTTPTSPPRIAKPSSKTRVQTRSKGYTSSYRPGKNVLSQNRRNKTGDAKKYKNLNLIFLRNLNKDLLLRNPKSPKERNASVHRSAYTSLPLRVKASDNSGGQIARSHSIQSNLRRNSPNNLHLFVSSTPTYELSENDYDDDYYDDKLRVPRQPPPTTKAAGGAGGPPDPAAGGAPAAENASGNDSGNGSSEEPPDANQAIVVRLIILTLPTLITLFMIGLMMLLCMKLKGSCCCPYLGLSQRECRCCLW